MSLCVLVGRELGRLRKVQIMHILTEAIANDQWGKKKKAFNIMVLFRERIELPAYILHVLSKIEIKNLTCILIDLTFNVMPSTSFRQNGEWH